MHELVCFNEKFIHAENAKISAISSAAFYGKGVFTTVAVKRGAKPFLWEKHWRRLNENAAKLGIDLSPFSAETIENSLRETIEANKFANGRARITFFDESASKIWNFAGENGTRFLITTANLPEKKKDLRLTVSPYMLNSYSPLAGVKSCNYLEKVLALDEAKSRGFDEAVQSNERGKLVSACMANIFWLKDGKLFTPAIETGCLRGTTRDFLMEKFDVAEVEAAVETLMEADAVFLTSAGIGIVQIAKFETVNFTRNFGKITEFSHI